LTPEAKNIKKFENNCVGPRCVKKKFCDTWSVGQKRKNRKKKFFFVILMINLNKFSLLVGHNY